MARTRFREGEARQPVPFVATGSTLLNLAMSDLRCGGYRLGKMVNTIGDSSSGKTLLALTGFAEMARRKRFDDYRFVFDDIEAANQFDIPALLGDRVADRDTIEDFEANFMDLLDGGRPFFYIQDSFDALTSDDDLERAKERVKARRAGKDVKGSYGMAKPKFISSMLSRVVRKLDGTGSVAVIISQTRDNINPMSFAKKTRSGGRALKFYAGHEMWLAIAKTLKKGDKAVGIICRIKITKNKSTGKIREIQFPIYYDYGIDDMGSCVDWMVAEGHWTGKTKIKSDFGEMSRAKLIRHIEDNDMEVELQRAVAKAWRAGEEALKPNKGRKRTYQ